MPTVERFDSEGRETLPEHRAAMNAPVRPHRVGVGVLGMHMHILTKEHPSWL